MWLSAHCFIKQVGFDKAECLKAFDECIYAQYSRHATLLITIAIVSFLFAQAIYRAQLQLL